jgi:hypothetical protein
MDGNQMISHFAPENTHLSAPRIDAVTEDEVVIGAATLPFASAQDRSRELSLRKGGSGPQL